MERLTKKEMLVGHEVHYISGDDCFEVGTMAEKFMGKAIDTLAQYEDTGLSPETVSDLLDRFTYFYRTVEGLDLVDPVHFGAFVDRVKRWQQAEKDGRLVMMPVSPYLKPTQQNEMYICEEGEVVDIYVTGCEAGPNSDGVFTVLYSAMDGYYFSADDIGKTVFLTRKEAEVALKKREESV